MKHIIIIILVSMLCCQCSAQRKPTVWVVKDLKTNYVQKGKSDSFELPLDLKGKQIQIQDSLMVLSEIRRNFFGSYLSDELSDTLILEKKIYFKRQKSNEYTSKYPGDEFVECVQNDSDYCFASETFLNLLGFQGNKVTAYLSLVGKYSKAKCILFIIKDNKEVVLYSENDFLMLFLTKEQ